MSDVLIWCILFTTYIVYSNIYCLTEKIISTSNNDNARDRRLLHDRHSSLLWVVTISCLSCEILLLTSSELSMVTQVVRNIKLMKISKSLKITLALRYVSKKKRRNTNWWLGLDIFFFLIKRRMFIAFKIMIFSLS